MKWWPRSKPQQAASPSEDARCSLEQAHRALADAEALHRAADDLTRRADEVGDRWRETAARNHIAEALVDSIRRKVKHP